jgi:hypothetical protein
MKLAGTGGRLANNEPKKPKVEEEREKKKEGELVI